MDGQNHDEIDKGLSGNVCSSLHRIKDLDATLGGYFVFPEVYVGLEGTFALKFTLYEMDG